MPEMFIVQRLSSNEMCWNKRIINFVYKYFNLGFHQMPESN